MKDVDQLDVSKADQEAQQSAAAPWNMSEIRGSGERGCPGCTRLVSAPYLYPAASIWNRATSERGESHQKVTVQLQRIKETTQMINQFQEGGEIHIFYCSPNKNIKHKQITGWECFQSSTRPD